MKIKGVTNGKIRGQKKGDPIEFTPQEKFPLAVKDAVKAKTNEKEAWWAEDIKIVESDFRKKSAAGQSRFQDNSYTASGVVKIRVHNLATDDLVPCKTFNFKIAFEDAFDENGQPDLKILQFDLT